MLPNEFNAIPIEDLANKLGFYNLGNDILGNPHVGNFKFTIDPKQNTWYEKETNRKGDIADLVSIRLGHSKEDAIIWLAHTYKLINIIHTPIELQRQYAKLNGQGHLAVEYLIDERNIAEKTAKEMLTSKRIGFATWHNPAIEKGNPGYGGNAIAFIATNEEKKIKGIDFRYIDPEQNGCVTWDIFQLKDHIWCNWDKVKNAETIYFVNSPIDALSIDSTDIPKVASIATRHMQSFDLFNWSFLRGKQIIFAYGLGELNKGKSQTIRDTLRLHRVMLSKKIASTQLNYSAWPENCKDINDLLKKHSLQELKSLLLNLDTAIILGIPKNQEKVYIKPSYHLPKQDYAIYWKYNAKTDFTTLTVMRKDEEGNQVTNIEDLCGFRIASFSKIEILSETAMMQGSQDNSPRTVFAATVQLPRHGNVLQTKTIEDKKIHDVNLWQEFGYIFKKAPFSRMLTIFERTANINASRAINFVGLAWKDGKLIVNEGTDCYFTEPEHQCFYNNLVFPSGKQSDAAIVIRAFQNTFSNNSGAMVLTWALSTHLKAFFGFWPHLIFEADKGSGKSTFTKQIEKAVNMTFLSGEGLETGFRVLTSLGYSSHPIGWEEFSAGRDQKKINSAVAMLQESYQYAIMRRNRALTRHLICGSVLLMGESVPVDTLIGKTISIPIGEKGDLIPDDIPQFPLRNWLDWLTTLNKKNVLDMLATVEKICNDSWQQLGNDEIGDNTGANRMISNWSALLLGWKLLCEFAGLDSNENGFIDNVIDCMNAHIARTKADRLPWVWILRILFAEIDSNNYKLPHQFDNMGLNNDPVLLVKTSHVMHYLKTAHHLSEEWRALPVKSDYVLRRQLNKAMVIYKDRVDRTINGKRESHLIALNLKKLSEYGLEISIPERYQTNRDD